MFRGELQNIQREFDAICKDLSNASVHNKQIHAQLERLEARYRSIERAAKHKLPRHGIDVAWGSPNPHALLALGYDFIMRYYSYDATKNLTQTEAEDYSHAGLDIVSIWESTGQSPLLGYDIGGREAHAALDIAEKVKQPDHTPIYFTVDFEPTDEQWHNIEEYFRGCVDVLGRHRVGVYGGLSTVVRLHKKVGWLYQTYAWSGGKWYGHNNIRQYRNDVQVNGVACDLDLAVTPYFGQWRV